MPAAYVPLVIDQGEDFTAQLIWTNGRGDPQPVTNPIRLDIKDSTMTLVSLTTPDPDPGDGTIPEISYSTDVGLIQIHISKAQTATLPPGLYEYDMFASVDDGFTPPQQQRILVGQVTVNKRITVL